MPYSAGKRIFCQEFRLPGNSSELRGLACHPNPSYRRKPVSRSLARSGFYSALTFLDSGLRRNGPPEADGAPRLTRSERLRCRDGNLAPAILPIVAVQIRYRVGNVSLVGIPPSSLDASRVDIFVPTDACKENLVMKIKVLSGDNHLRQPDATRWRLLWPALLVLALATACQAQPTATPEPPSHACPHRSPRAHGNTPANSYPSSHSHPHSRATLRPGVLESAHRLLQ